MISSIDEAKCSGCGLCVEKCPLDTLRLNDLKMAYIAYPEDCMTCYICEVICPQNAIYVHPFKEPLPLSLVLRKDV